MGQDLGMDAGLEMGQDLGTDVGLEMGQGPEKDDGLESHRDGQDGTHSPPIDRHLVWMQILAM
jgi:hypothetical protein